MQIAPPISAGSMKVLASLFISVKALCSFLDGLFYTLYSPLLSIEREKVDLAKRGVEPSLVTLDLIHMQHLFMGFSFHTLCVKKKTSLSFGV